MICCILLFPLIFNDEDVGILIEFGLAFILIKIEILIFTLLHCLVDL